MKTMIRKKTTLKCKSGGVQNGNGAGHPRALIDLAMYRESVNRWVWRYNRSHGGPIAPQFWDPKYSGLSNASRPRDYAIFLRPIQPTLIT